MKTSITLLALGIMASPMAAYGTQNPHRPVHSHRTTYNATGTSQWHDPFKPRRTDGLSSNPDACASYGCVGAGGGGD